MIPLYILISVMFDSTRNVLSVRLPRGSIILIFQPFLYRIFWDSPGTGWMSLAMLFVISFFLSTRWVTNRMKSSCVAYLNEKLNNGHLTWSTESFNHTVVRQASIPISWKIKMLMISLPLESSSVETLPHNSQLPSWKHCQHTMSIYLLESQTFSWST